MQKLLLMLAIVASQTLMAQNVGIGITVPLAPLHIATGASGNLTPFSPLVVEGNNNTYINLLSTNTSETGVLFGKADNAASGAIVYNNINTLNGFQFRTNGNVTQVILDNAGNVGIGVVNPQAKLDVNGNIKTNSLIISTGGAVSDFLIKNNAAGLVSFRKGYVGLGLNYIIALEGAYPNTNPPFVDGTYIGEIKLFSANNAPYGWAFCNGQLLTVNSNPLLFALIGTTYGGDGVNNFRLPDLRDAVPVHPGTNWQLGERSN